MGPAHIVAVVALQAFVVVAGPSLVAVLVELGGTHLAAAAAVGDRADPRGAGRGSGGALAHHGAACSHLQPGDIKGRLVQQNIGKQLHLAFRV